jgi:diketogulonate reductase-like aldo/keto reductase
MDRWAPATVLSRATAVLQLWAPALDRVRRRLRREPALNQIELHPYLPQADLRAYHREHGIATEAWSPIGQGGDLLHEPSIAGLADKRGRSPAQIVLRWHIQLGDIVFPKSTTPSRIAENIDVFDFELPAEDMATIAGLENGTRMGPDPDEFG